MFLRVVKVSVGGARRLTFGRRLKGPTGAR
jgi:hypothetical protein